ncbi:ATP-binding protein [Fibrisoma montanum]|uniref:ATP-binding protein n=1 Tax=Fibrisoma montanum TaxID=2305895 RepID=A0A418M1H6_9BACT|nr:ATP-binding protein [Fibrisoma montanum]RIV19471.1 ATP-binding protein [Fibrisoma montanum]
MGKIITGRDVLRQLKADLIGKDSHRGVTFTYSWLANQLGHYTLGFIPTLFLYAILRSCTDLEKPATWAALGIAGLWFGFEIYNFLGPLLSKRVSRAKRLFVPGRSKYVFQPDWLNIAYDTATDVGFFWLGAYSAYLYVTPSACAVYLWLFLLLLVPCRHWYITKMYLQAAQYPFQCRLSQWAFPISEADRQTVLSFLNAKRSHKHLLIFGGRGNGKTSLGIGIATERSIRHDTCFYTTGMKLYSMFPERNSKSLHHNKPLWTWRQASLLVIDDINPGGLIEDLITPVQFLQLLRANPNNLKTLADKDVIWILGQDDQHTVVNQKWADMLHEIGVDKKDIHSVRLPLKA